MIRRVCRWIKDNSSELQVLIEILTILVLIAGAWAGWKALSHYDKSNKAQMIYTLYEFDKETIKAVIDKPYLQAIFAEPHKDVDIKQASLQILSLFKNKNDKDNVSLDWKYIPDLYSKLFHPQWFNCLGNERLREGYFIAESILYTLFNAYLAKEDKLIYERDYKSYLGYFYEVGHNPLFLCAIFDGHKYGYITKDFAYEIQNRFKKDEYIVKVIREIYPDLLHDDWPSRINDMD